MRHLVAVLLDTDSEPHRIKISHHKDYVFDPSNKEEAGKAIAADINTLTTGLVMAIRHGGDIGVLNKLETMHKVFDHLQRSISMIDLSQETADLLNGLPPLEVNTKVVK